MMITTEWAQQFADEWVQAWNAHDLPRILSHYSDDFEFASPVIIALGFSADGKLKGKSAIRAYWTKGLEMVPPIKFELLEVFAGIDCVTIYYRSVARKLVCETFFFDDEQRVMKSVAAYGRPVT